MSVARTAVVTGAAGTIGQGTVEALVQDGRRVLAVDRDSERLARLVDRYGSDRVAVVGADITDEQAGAVIAKAAAERKWDPVTILVNNAGISPKHDGMAASIFEVSRDEWIRVFDVNVTAQLLLARAFIPNMQKVRWGRIVNVSSRAGRSNVNSAGPAYVTSKAAVLGLTRSIACDFAADGITCNAVAPGFVESDMTRQLPAHLYQRLLDKTPIGRPGQPRELGAVIAFLASEHSGFVTGACVDANGGQTML